MNKFSNSKIYRIVNDINGMTYYGSTHQKLSKRMGDHRASYKIKKNKTYLKFGEISDCKIFLIENFPCDSKEELLKRERYYIESMNCINTQIPGQTMKEWYIKNKDILKQKSKEFRLKNIDKIKEQKKTRTICECGLDVNKDGIARHKRSKKHIKFMESKSI